MIIFQRWINLLPLELTLPSKPRLLQCQIFVFLPHKQLCYALSPLGAFYYELVRNAINPFLDSIQLSHRMKMLMSTQSEECIAFLVVTCLLSCILHVFKCTTSSKPTSYPFFVYLPKRILSETAIYFWATITFSALKNEFVLNKFFLIII